MNPCDVCKPSHQLKAQYMPQMNPLVLKDRASPAVDHSFKPKNGNGGVTAFVESVGVPLGDRRITVSQTQSQNGRIRVTIKLAVPVVQSTVIDNVVAPKLIRTNYADLVFNFDATSSAQERADIAAFVTGICAGDNAMMVAVIKDLEGLY